MVLCNGAIINMTLKSFSPKSYSTILQQNIQVNKMIFISTTPIQITYQINFIRDIDTKI